ncbi:MAG: aspartate--tRNA(Asn) ligase [Bacteriovoracaceae bacterium]|jgi:nondiscriminating aspartyl-tRNA synthetase|nr:aspartate--tRNA(Asn) ligase [Bacteriovoracaceae bacterium]
MKLIGESKVSELSELKRNQGAYFDQSIDFSGTVGGVRDLKKFAFVQLLTEIGLVQLVLESEKFKEAVIKIGGAISVSAIVKKAKLKDQFLSLKEVEFFVTHLEVNSIPNSAAPMDLTKKELMIGNDVKFDLRMISLRHPKEAAIFSIQSGITSGFRKYFEKMGLTEIRTPKIVAAGAEGGANIFKLNYFGKDAFLTQSPQFYKEFCTAAFGGIYEIAPVFRAEKHNTSRHLSEYTSVDVEIAHIKSFYDIMEFEVGALRFVMGHLRQNHSHQLEIMGIELKEIGDIPSITFKEAKEVLKREGIESGEPSDLSPEEEKGLCAFVLEKYDSELVFVTHYPTSKRPFYAMESSLNSEETDSFDLLYKGVEITTGGQRIHELASLTQKMKKRSMDIESFEFFTNAHKYGLPPHGGFGLGLERFTQKLLNLDSVKLATMFPRDVTRLFP